LLVADTTSVAAQGDERGLAGVLGRVNVGRQHPPANAPYQRPVPPDEQLEGSRITGEDEAIEQLTIRDRVQGRMEATDELKQRSGGHSVASGNAWFLGDRRLRTTKPSAKIECGQARPKAVIQVDARLHIVARAVERK
jgi:hypothetical protein